MENKLFQNLEQGKILLKPYIYKKAGIYKLVNLKNGKFYVGSSNNLYRRLIDYLNPLGLKKVLNKGRSHIINALLKHGYDNFGIVILEIIEFKEDLSKQEKIKQIFETEMFYINLLKPDYNILTTIGNPSELRFPLETLKKMKENNNRNQKTYVYDLEGNLVKIFMSFKETSRELAISNRIIAARLKNNNQEPIHLFKKDKTQSYIFSLNHIENIELKSLIEQVKTGPISLNQKTKGHNKQHKVYYSNEKVSGSFNSLAEAGRVLEASPSTILNYAKSGLFFKGFKLSLVN